MRNAGVTDFRKNVKEKTACFSRRSCMDSCTESKNRRIFKYPGDLGDAVHTSGAYPVYAYFWTLEF